MPIKLSFYKVCCIFSFEVTFDGRKSYGKTRKGNSTAKRFKTGKEVITESRRHDVCLDSCLGSQRLREEGLRI